MVKGKTKAVANRLPQTLVDPEAVVIWLSLADNVRYGESNFSYVRHSLLP